MNGGWERRCAGMRPVGAREQMRHSGTAEGRRGEESIRMSRARSCPKDGNVETLCRSIRACSSEV